MASQSDTATIQRAWKETFLAALADSPNVSAAARLAGVNRQYAYRVRDEDPEFGAAWDDAVATAADDLEGRVHDATRVIDNPVSLQAAIFLLKAHRPERFRERSQTEITGKDGQPLVPQTVKVEFVDADSPPQDPTPE